MNFIEELKEYLADLKKTFQTNPVEILYSAVLLWGFAPILIFGIRETLYVIIKHELSIVALTRLIMAIVPWWANVILNPLGALVEYLACFIITLILVQSRILKLVKPKRLVKFLFR